MTGFRHMPICNDTGKADCVEVQQLIILREESDFSISMFSNFIAACSSLPLLPVSSHLYLTTFFFPRRVPVSFLVCLRASFSLRLSSRACILKY